DVAVNIVPIAAPVPGFYYTNQIKYTNLGSDSTSGTITFAHSDNITFNNVSEMVTNISNGFTLDFNNLLPFETRTIDVVYSIPTIPIINLGDIVTSEVAITALNIDNISNNNFYVLNSAIRSEERRVGKECRSRSRQNHTKIISNRRRNRWE